MSGLDEYVAATVRRLGPPTREQVVHVRAIIAGAQGGAEFVQRVPDPREQERLAEALRKAERVRKIRSHAASLMECGGCGAPPEAHVRSAGLHEWEPRKDVLAMLDQRELGESE